MVTPATEVSQPTAASAEARVNPKHDAPQERSANKRAEAVKAKRKQKRDAHRVTLRRSHTKG